MVSTRKLIIAMLLVLTTNAITNGKPISQESTFKAVLNQPTNRLQTTPFYGDFTSKGRPIEETLIPLPRNIHEVVSDNTGDLFFGMGGHELYQLDLTNRNAIEIKAQGVPEISWAMGLSYDTKRNRVLLATLGGDGYIYAYDHQNKTWSLVNNLNNVDVTAIAYMESSDRIFAIGEATIFSSHEGPALYEYSAVSGRLLQARAIDLPMRSDVHDSGHQLIPVEDSLVFIQMPSFSNNLKKATIHRINPKTGQVKRVKS